MRKRMPIIGDRESAKHKPGGKRGQRRTRSAMSDQHLWDLLAICMYLQLAVAANKT